MVHYEPETRMNRCDECGARWHRDIQTEMAAHVCLDKPKLMVEIPKRKRQFVVEECEPQSKGHVGIIYPPGVNSGFAVRIVREIQPEEVHVSQWLGALERLPSDGPLTVAHLAALEKMRRLLLLFASPTTGSVAQAQSD